MPLMKKPGSFPGLDKLPPLAKALIERAFPPDQLPAPMGTFLHRAPADIAKVLGPPAKALPQIVPQTLKKVGSEVDQYASKIAQMLQRAKPE